MGWLLLFIIFLSFFPKPLNKRTHNTSARRICTILKRYVRIDEGIVYCIHKIECFRNNNTITIINARPSMFHREELLPAYMYCTHAKWKTNTNAQVRVSSSLPSLPSTSLSSSWSSPSLLLCTLYVHSSLMVLRVDNKWTNERVDMCAAFFSLASAVRVSFCYRS